MNAFTYEELQRLLAVAKSESARDHLMLLLGFNHGMRVSEICGLLKSDLSCGQIKIRRLKGSLTTLQPLTPEEVELLDRYVPTVEGDLVFPGTDRFQMHRMIRSHGKAARIHADKCHMHSLKHTLGMLMVKHTDLERVRARLGHRSIATTSKFYAQCSDDDAAQAFDSAMAKYA